MRKEHYRWATCTPPTGEQACNLVTSWFMVWCSTTKPHWQGTEIFLIIGKTPGSQCSQWSNSYKRAILVQNHHQPNLILILLNLSPSADTLQPQKEATLVFLLFLLICVPSAAPTLLLSSTQRSPVLFIPLRSLFPPGGSFLLSGGRP